MTGVLRAKGFFWLATRPHWIGELSQAGALVRHHAIGRWWDAIPRRSWPTGRRARRAHRQGLAQAWGDRRQELVFIGTRSMDHAAIKAALDACLLPVASLARAGCLVRLPGSLSGLARTTHGDEATPSTARGADIDKKKRRAAARR